MSDQKAERAGGILFWIVLGLVIGLILIRCGGPADPGPCEGLDDERATVCFEQLQNMQEDRER